VAGRRGRRGKQLLDDLKEREDSGNLNRKQYVAIYGQIALEEAWKKLGHVVKKTFRVNE